MAFKPRSISSESDLTQLLKHAGNVIHFGKKKYYYLLLLSSQKDFETRLMGAIIFLLSVAFED